MFFIQYMFAFEIVKVPFLHNHTGGASCVGATYLISLFIIVTTSLKELINLIVMFVNS